MVTQTFRRLVVLAAITVTIAAEWRMAHALTNNAALMSAMQWQQRGGDAGAGTMLLRMGLFWGSLLLPVLLLTLLLTGLGILLNALDKRNSREGARRSRSQE